MIESTLPSLRPVYETHLWCHRGHFNTDQALLVAEVCAQIAPRYALEVGFCTGRSAASVLHATRSVLRRMVSLDRDLGYKAPEGRFMARLLCAEFPTFSVIEQPSQRILGPAFFRASFGDGVDLAIIDGGHSYEECSFDLQAAASALSYHGVILVDDFHSGPPNGVAFDTVNAGVDDFMQRHRSSFVGQSWHKEGKGMCLIRRRT